MEYDLCIVGAGMYGSAAARYASADPTVKVILIGPEEPNEKDIDSREIFGSHYDEGRIVMILDTSMCNQVLATKSIQRYRELEELSGIEFYKHLGFLAIAKRSSECLEQIKREAEMGKIPIQDINSNSELETRFSFLRMDTEYAAVFENSCAGHISPRKLVNAQKIVAKSQGCIILNDIVEEVAYNDLCHKIITARKEIIKAKRVLICTGAFTNFKRLIPRTLSLIPEMSVDKETAVLMEISKHEAERLKTMPPISWFKSESLNEDVIGVYILPPIEYPDAKHYLKIGHIHMPGGSLKSLREIKQWYQGNGDTDMLEELPKWMMKLLPGLEILNTKPITCVSCSNSTEMPYIEKVKPTITVAIVGNAKGAKLSDEIGRLAAKLSLHDVWDTDLPKSAFSIVWTEKE